MNTNALHNILNIVIAVIAALGAMDWSVIMSPSTAAMVVTGLATVKVIVNVLRDGLSGLTKPQPPVEK